LLILQLRRPTDCHRIRITDALSSKSKQHKKKKRKKQEEEEEERITQFIHHVRKINVEAQSEFMPQTHHCTVNTNLRQHQ
jgi:hypothetical protein